MVQRLKGMHRRPTRHFEPMLHQLSNSYCGENDLIPGGKAVTLGHIETPGRFGARGEGLPIVSNRLDSTCGHVYSMGLPTAS